MLEACSKARWVADQVVVRIEEDLVGQGWTGAREIFHPQRSRSSSVCTPCPRNPVGRPGGADGQCGSRAGLGLQLGLDDGRGGTTTAGTGEAGVSRRWAYPRRFLGSGLDGRRCGLSAARHGAGMVRRWSGGRECWAAPRLRVCRGSPGWETRWAWSLGWKA